MKFIILFFLVFNFSSVFSFDAIEIKYDQLDEKIKSIISCGKNDISKIESLNNGKRLIIHYADTFYNSKIFFEIREDIYVNKNQLQLFLDFSNRNKKYLDNDLIISQLKQYKSGVKRIRFNKSNTGIYKDKELHLRKTNFNLFIALYDINGSKLIDPEINFIPLTEFKIDYNLISVIVFNSQTKGYKLQKNIRIQRYRQILFDIKNIQLLSNSIISPISLLTE
jgi:hypothetical protein